MYRTVIATKPIPHELKEKIKKCRRKTAVAAVSSLLARWQNKKFGFSGSKTIEKNLWRFLPSSVNISEPASLITFTESNFQPLSIKKFPAKRKFQ